MKKENNCKCVVCQIEQSLLKSLSTQTSRTHFQTLASNYPVLNHFDSPADVIVKLHEHEQVEVKNHNAWDGILHAVVNAIADRTTEEVGQQLLLVAFTPAIHKTYNEVCQQFPTLTPEDVAQQALLCFLEAAKSPAMLRQNGYLPVALVRNFRKNMFRWAIKEAHPYAQIQGVPIEFPEPPNTSFEYVFALQAFLKRAQRDGLLSSTECDLLLKLKCEGFEVKEVAKALGANPLSVHRRLHRKLQTILNRLQRTARNRERSAEGAVRCESPLRSSQTNKIPDDAVNFSENVPISKSEIEMGYSPEPPKDVPQFEPGIPQITA
jgi:DNA-directed RNA polymerase specialized sigma24 family protein